jgi:hypothetical protein
MFPMLLCKRHWFRVSLDTRELAWSAVSARNLTRHRELARIAIHEVNEKLRHEAA